MRTSCATAVDESLREQDLPRSVRDLLNATRASHPGTDVTCVAFHTSADGCEIVRMGPMTSANLGAKDVVVLSVTTTETTSEDVRTLTHVLVARMKRR